MVPIANPRRGVLLLVVLSVLTLFLMLGATYVAVATRARKASRAFADNVITATNGRATEARLLDEVFLTVARGTTLPLTSGTALAHGDDLLGDKYGTQSLTGVVGAATPYLSSPAFIQLSLSGSLRPVAPTNVSDLVGRVITLNLPGLAASTRILSATGPAGSPTLVIPAGPTPAGTVISVAKITAGISAVSGTSATTLVINGREFDGATTNEAYDGFDLRNPLLTRIVGGSSGPPNVSAAPLSGTAGLDVDNDGDGVGDSGWIDLNLPAIVDASGRSLRPQAAILVLDLDGRLNVNAHGSTAEQETFDTTTGRNTYPTYATGSAFAPVPLYQLPRGMAGGPASVSLSRSLLFSATTSEQTVVQGGLEVLGGQQANGRKASNAAGREVPAIRGSEGRYADGVWPGSFASIAQPGVSGSNDRISLAADRWRATLTGDVAQSYFVDPGRFGSPWDVKGRMKLWVDGFGQPVYYKPSWSAAAPTNDVVDDPYEVNLTRSGARTGYTAAPAASTVPPDNLYTPAELEGLLRYDDPDSLKLPRRLVALNEDQAERNRLLVTTDSWDTPAVTGTSWQAAIGTRFAALLTSATAVAPNRARDLFGPELVMGHKLDLNRPFHEVPNFDEPNDATGVARRQAFARQLYCLMMAVAQQNGVTVTGTTARQIAQYAVNVVDYRDGDSAMTKFAYDPAFSGTSTTWTTGSTNYVWGCERPELLITETLAWHNRRTDDESEGGKIEEPDQTRADDDLDQKRRPWGAFFVELYSPWSSQYGQYVSGSASLSGTNGRAEPVPAGLTASGSTSFAGVATISLNKRAAGTSPVWRLASVRGKVQGGTGFDAAGAIRDPSTPEVSGSSAAVDRVFYFAQPAVAALTNPTDPRNGQPGGVFWTTATATAQPSPSQHIVVGTDGLRFDPSDTPPTLGSGYTTATPPALPYNQQVHLRFDSPSNNARTPATLSEPINTTGTNRDPYEAVAEATGGRTPNKFVPDDNAQPHRYSDDVKLQQEVDTPLDANVAPVPDVSPPFLTHADSGLPAGRPMLMFNGTHDNFAIIHLQRLADPEKAWDANDNPYITVDSMPVDLTVVNSRNGNLTQCWDEPGQSPCLADASGDLIVPIQPGPNALTWLQTQKAFGPETTNEFSTAERGGKQWQAPPDQVAERDIWSRRATILKPTVSGTTLLPLISDPNALRTAATGVRPATTLGTLGSPPNRKPELRATSNAPRLANTTLKETTTANAKPVRWARGEVDANNDGILDPSEDANTNGIFDPPRYAWLAWPNRPFSSIVDLALVPTTSPFDLTGKHSVRTTGTASPDFYHLPGFFEDTAPAEPWLSLAGRSGTNAVNLFDFVHIPSPFAGVYTTVPLASNTNALTALGHNTHPVNNLSSFREPGRVNINTITDRRVWRALFGDVNVRGDIGDLTTDDPLPPTPDLRDRLPGWSETLFAQPETTTTPNSATRATSLFDFFRNMPNAGYSSRPSTPRNGGFVDSFTDEDANTNGVLDYGEDANKNGILDPGEDADGDGALDTEDRNRNFALDLNYHRDTDRNAFFRYQTMRQLSNVVTTRSNVYAVWVTIRYVDSTGQEVRPIRRSRAFYIFDRSIPVAYERGEDHNVRDAILLRRIIQ